MLVNKLIMEAVKSGDKQRASVLRVLAGELARLPSKEYTNEQMYSAARKMIKNAETYPTEATALEIQILRSVLPVERSDEEILAAISTATSIKEAMFMAPADVEKSRVSALFRSRTC